MNFWWRSSPKTEISISISFFFSNLEPCINLLSMEDFFANYFFIKFHHLMNRLQVCKKFFAFLEKNNILLLFFLVALYLKCATFRYRNALIFIESGYILSLSLQLKDEFNLRKKKKWNDKSVTSIESADIHWWTG